MEYTDDELVAKSLEGDREAGQELYLRYALFLFRLAYKTTQNRAAAEDLCQETWLRVFKNLPDYQPGTSFRSWSASICYRLGIDWIRRQQTREKADPVTIQDRLNPETASARREAEEREFMARVRSLLQNLPETGQAAFFMRYFEDFSYREIGQAQGCPEKTARTKVFRVVRALRRHLDEPELLEGGAA